MAKLSWKEEAWDNFLKAKWDNRPKGSEIVFYNKSDLHPILKKYGKSGQGEIRIFHSSSENVKAVQARNIKKIPISRSEWAIVKRMPPLKFSEPNDSKEIDKEKTLTPGMQKAVDICLGKGTNPGETTMMAIAKHVGIISDFYNLDDSGVHFTGGRQSAHGCHLIIDNKEIDLSRAQLEIDGGYEWADQVVLVEMKSSFKQDNFDVNQCLLPLLKWRGLLENKEILALVLLAEIVDKKLVYYAYDLIHNDQKPPLSMEINKSKKYIVNI